MLRAFLPKPSKSSLNSRSAETFVAEDDAGARLDRFVVRHFAAQASPPLSGRKAKALIEGGSVVVDGTPVRSRTFQVRAGQRVVVSLPEERAPELLELGAADVRYEDSSMIAINKPAGWVSQPTRDPRRDNVETAVRRMLADRGDGPVDLHLVHRLDRDTSGVLLFSVDRSSNRPLQAAFAERRVHKLYWALVRGVPQKDEWTVDNHLSPERGTQRAVTSGGDRATTRFRTVDRGRGWAVVEAEPKTGRMHQIRSHLSESGYPILGDERYGGPPNLDQIRVGRVMLHAERLVIPHPRTAEAIEIVAPIANDFLELRSKLPRA